MIKIITRSFTTELSTFKTKNNVNKQSNIPNSLIFVLIIIMFNYEARGDFYLEIVGLQTFK